MITLSRYKEVNLYPSPMKKKKKAEELTNEEIARRLFPKKVRDKAKEVAHEKDKKKPS